MSGCRQFKESKEYRSRPKIRCNYCGHPGRDVQKITHIKNVDAPVCKNCRSKFH